MGGVFQQFTSTLLSISGNFAPEFTLLARKIRMADMSAEAAKEKFVRSKPHLAVAVNASDIDLAGFQAVSGLGIDIEVIEDDTTGSSVRKRPGRTRWEDITLKRGFAGTSDVEDWANEAFLGEPQRREVTVLVHDRDMRVVRTYLLSGAFPVKWRLMTDDDGHLIEEVTLTFEQIRTMR